MNPKPKRERELPDGAQDAIDRDLDRSDEPDPNAPAWLPLDGDFEAP